MRYFWSAVGLLAFTAISGFHFMNLGHVAAFHLPDRTLVSAAGVVVLWVGGVGLMVYAMRTNRLMAPFLIVFLYVMAATLAGTQVLQGVPAKIGEGEWRDPHGRLTPEAEYLLHNHSNVVRVLSEAEYELFLNYVACYFSAGLMGFAACLCLFSWDRDGQLQGRRSLARPVDPAQPGPVSRCPACKWLVPADVEGHWPPWCPHCGANFAAEG
jgi:hypothetical protein